MKKPNKVQIKTTEEIRTELSRYYKKHKHVLFYGNSRINLKGLVLDVHIENGGKTYTVQYVGRETEEVFLEKMAEAIKNDRLKNKDEKKRYEEVREKYKSSEKSWRYLKGVHNVLYEVWRIVRIPFGCGMPIEIKRDEFLDFKGTLFVDMLDYDPEKDAEYLCKLADYIIEDKASFNWLVVYIYNGRDSAPKSFLKQFKHICLDGVKAVVESTKEVEPKKNQNTESGIKLRIVQSEEEVYWEGNLLPTIKAIDFRILIKLAKKPGELEKNEKLNELIDSDHNKDVLLNQRITAIRKAFPSPYSDIKQSQCIIPDAKRNKGYRSLNLTKEQVEIV